MCWSVHSYYFATVFNSYFVRTFDVALKEQDGILQKLVLQLHVFYALSHCIDGQQESLSIDVPADPNGNEGCDKE